MNPTKVDRGRTQMLLLEGNLPRTKLERVRRPTEGVLSYLEGNVLRNAVDIWALMNEGKRYELYTSSVDGKPMAHLGIFTAPEAKYASLGGAITAAEPLLDYVPKRAVLTVPPELGEIATARLRHDAVIPGDLMAVERGKAKLGDTGQVRRLGTADAEEYLGFGSSFNMPAASKRWALDRLAKNVIFGAFSGGRLAAVANIVAWLPKMAVIMGVQTKPEFRRKGLGTAVVSAAVQEALRRSEACSLYVTSDNTPAIELYRKLGFKKVGNDLWVDIGTGISP